jgi:hypothetical protein
MIKPKFPLTWGMAESLGKYCVRMINEKKTETPEFQTVLNYFGKDYLRELVKKELEKHEKKEPCENS